MGDQKAGGKEKLWFLFPSFYLSFPSSVLWKWLLPDFLLERLEGAASFTDAAPEASVTPPCSQVPFVPSCSSSGSCFLQSLVAGLILLPLSALPVFQHLRNRFPVLYPLCLKHLAQFLFPTQSSLIFQSRKPNR